MFQALVALKVLFPCLNPLGNLEKERLSCEGKMLLCPSAAGGLAATEQWFAWCNREVVSHFFRIGGSWSKCWMLGRDHLWIGFVTAMNSLQNVFLLTGRDTDTEAPTARETWKFATCFIQTE